MDSRWALPIGIIAVIVVSGCSTIADPTSVANLNPVVNQFLKEHPNADVRITHYSADEASNVINQIASDCGKTTIIPVEFYLVNITDTATGLYITSWINWKDKFVECAVKRGTNEAGVTPTPPTNPPAETQLKECFVYNSIITNGVGINHLCNSNQDCESYLALIPNGSQLYPTTQCLPTSFEKLGANGTYASCSSNDDCYNLLNIPSSADSPNAAVIISSMKSVIRCNNDYCEVTQGVLMLFDFAAIANQLAQEQQAQIRQCTDAKVLIQRAFYDSASKNLTLTIYNYGRTDLRFQAILTYSNVSMHPSGGTQIYYRTADVTAGKIVVFDIEGVDNDLDTVSIKSTTCDSPCMECPGAQDFLRYTDINGLGYT